MEFLLSGEISIDRFAARRTSHLRGSVPQEKRENGLEPRLLRGSSGGRKNVSSGPEEISHRRRHDRNLSERNGERVASAPKLGWPGAKQREPVVLRSGGLASNLQGPSGEDAGHESDANSVKSDYLGSGCHHSIPTCTTHDELHPGAGVLPRRRNLECTCAINDRCLVRTQDGHRVVIASGIVLAQYALGDHMAESYAIVNLVDQGLAKQSDVARAFGCSTRTVRRHRRRFEDGGLATLGRPLGYPLGRPRLVGWRRQLVLDLNLEGHSHREIARRIGVSERTVRKLVRSR